MEDLSATRPELRPNTISYNTIISAYAKNGNIDQAEHILQRMEQQSQSQSQSQSESQSQSGSRCGSCPPDTVTYNSIINGLSMSSDPNGGERAEAILRRMEEMRRMEKMMMIPAGADGAQHAQPDLKSYTSVVNAFAKRGAAGRAEAILNDMVYLYQQGNDNLKPTILSFNTVCNSYAKSECRNDGDRALALLHRMETLHNAQGEYYVQPDIVTYTSVLDALSKQGTKDSAQKALDLLQVVERKYQETKNVSIKPNVRTYTSVINAISKSKVQPQRAQDILDRIEAVNELNDDTTTTTTSADNDDDDNHLQIDVDSVCYNAVLNAWGWSSAPDKVQQANKLFHRMLHLYASGRNVRVKPNLVTLNSLLNACAFARVKGGEGHAAAVLEVATNAFEQFVVDETKYGSANGLTYGIMLKIFNKFLPRNDDLRTEKMKNVFHQCCQNGYLDVSIFSQLKKGVSTVELKHLLGDGFLMDTSGKVRIDKRKIPEHWYQNEMPKKRRK